MKKTIRMIALMMVLVLGSMNIMEIRAEELSQTAWQDSDYPITLSEEGEETEEIQTESTEIPETEQEPETEAIEMPAEEIQAEAAGEEKGTEESTEQNTEQNTEENTEENTETETPEEKTIRVLMVGNSFTRYTTGGKTYTVEQPLEELAKAEGHNLEVTTLAHGSARLRYYAGSSPTYISYYKELLAFLINESWDYIIFQEQSTAPIEYFDTYTYPAVETLLGMVTKFQPQATPLLYMTPGYSNGTAMKVNGVSRVPTAVEHQLYLAAAYKTLENKLGIEAVPVGMHTLRANLLYPEIQMTGPDAKHPTYAGYYLAACAFYQKIYGTVPDPLKASLTNCNLTGEQLTALALLAADSMTMNQKNITLPVNETSCLNATPCSHIAGTSAVLYKSFDPGVAAVDEDTGVVTAKSGGSTIIVAATSDGLQAYCNVTVRVPLSFARSEYLAGIGDRIQILPQTNSANLKWSRNNASVASISSAGLVTAKASGRTVITVTNKDDATDKASYILYVACAAPTGLKTASAGKPAAAASYGNLKVSWTKVAGATGYEIYRSTSKTGTYTLIGTSKTTSYTDKTAAVNKCYYYKVKAKNAYSYCTSAFSGSTRGIILKAPAVAAKRVSKKYARLTWKKNTKATGYVIYRSTKKNAGFRKIATVSSNTKVSYTDKTVKKNKTYYYRIKAYKKLDGKIFYGVKSLRVEIKI